MSASTDAVSADATATENGSSSTPSDSPSEPTLAFDAVPGKSKWAQLSSLLRKSPRDQGLWLRAFLLVVVVRLGLKAWSYRGLREHLPRWFKRSQVRLSARQAETEARRIVWAVERASSLVPGATCLTQAFATQMLLCSRGEASQLCIGVARHPETGAFEAHAWIEHRDRLIIGGPRTHVARYQPIAAFDA